MDSVFSFLVGLLTAALSLLGFVQQHPELPQASRDQAQQVAQQAITQATQVLNNTSSSGASTQTSGSISNTTMRKGNVDLVLTTDKSSYEPGESIQFTLTATNNNGGSITYSYQDACLDFLPFSIEVDGKPLNTLVDYVGPKRDCSITTIQKILGPGESIVRKPLAYKIGLKAVEGDYTFSIKINSTALSSRINTAVTGLVANTVGVARIHIGKNKGSFCPKDYSSVVCGYKETRVDMGHDQYGCAILPKCVPADASSCSTEYKPVCGSIGAGATASMEGLYYGYSSDVQPGAKWFQNRCILEAVGATYMYDGKCTSQR